MSWAPSAVPGSLVSSKPEVGAVRRFVTGGSDNLVKIWDWRSVEIFPCFLSLPKMPDELAMSLLRQLQSIWTIQLTFSILLECSPSQKTYTPTLTLTGHTDWVRDVAWAPTLLQKSYIASASQDKTVRIWTCDQNNQQQPQEWKSTVLTFDAVLWRVSWSLSGNVLAVSGGDNRVSLWKENLKGEWDCVKWIEE